MGTIEAQLAEEQAHNESLSHQVAELEAQVAENDATIEALTREIEEGSLMASWRASGSSGKSAVDLKNEMAHLQNILSQMESEQNTNKQLQRQKTQMIEQLSKELDVRKTLEEDVFQAQNAIKSKERDLKELMDVMADLRRQEKRGVLHQNNIKKGEKAIQLAESDKRYLIAEITKLLASHKLQEKKKRVNQVRIDGLQQKFELITAFIIENQICEEQDGEGADTVTLRDFEDAQQDIIQHRQKLFECDEMLLQKDAAIEALEKKVDILLLSCNVDEKVLFEDRKDKMLHINKLKQKLDDTNEAQRTIADHLREENARLRRQSDGRRRGYHA